MADKPKLIAPRLPRGFEDRTPGAIAAVDAMIENSGPIAVGPEEWLTIAARDNVPRDPLIPTDTADTRTVMFRLKGSDLAAFRAGRATLEETRKKVETREH